MTSPAGWHQQQDGRERYWDGSQWTDQFRDPTADPGAGGVTQATTNSPKKSKKHLIGYPATAVGALLVGVGMGSAAGDTTSPTAGSPSGTSSSAGTPSVTTVTQTVAPKAAPATTVFKTVTSTPQPVSAIDEGVWEVGVDVKAGRYKVHEALTGDCYWEINKTGSDDIVSNGAPTGGRPVALLKKGQTFTNQGCGIWSKVG